MCESVCTVCVVNIAFTVFNFSLFLQVVALGCRSFAILFDDIECDMCPADEKVFPSFAHAQVNITNEIYSHLDHPEIFMFCPTGQFVLFYQGLLRVNPK